MANSGAEPPSGHATYTVIKGFVARLGDELDLHVGDVIEVITDDAEYNDGWYMGRNVTTGKAGLYPKTFTQPTMQRAALRKAALPGATGPSLTDIDLALRELESDHVRPPLFQMLDAAALNPAEATRWSPEQVSAYFAYLGFDLMSAGQFARHKVLGEILLELELTYLKELDIALFGTRFEMYKEIEALRAAVGGTGLLAGFQPPQPPAADATLVLSRNLLAALLLLLATTRRNNLPALMPAHAVSRLQLGQPHTPLQPLLRQSFLPDQDLLLFQAPTTPLVDANAFELPRKAPQPPPGPSPVEKMLYRRSVGDFLFPARLALKLLTGDLRRTSTRSGLARMRPQSTFQGQQSLAEKLPENHQRHTLDVSTYNLNERLHRRHSSLFSFVTEGDNAVATTSTASRADGKQDAATAPQELADGDVSTLTKVAPPLPMRLTLERDARVKLLPEGKRLALDTFRLKLLKSLLALNLRQSLGIRKQQTLAFQEGIQNITPKAAGQLATHSGWMSKRGLLIGLWKQRYFTLHETRLSYFVLMKDTKEKGLIDITAHRVLPARGSEDRLTAMAAATTGSGRFCFKLVPPAPGTKKGLTFTQQKVHYFAVETHDEMRDWMAALMKATIDVDETVPVVLLCVTPTVLLARAQDMLVKAREEARAKDEQLRTRGFLQPGALQPAGEVVPESDDTGDSGTTPTHRGLSLRILLSGMALPYLLASGALTPKSPLLPILPEDYFAQNPSTPGGLTTPGGVSVGTGDDKPVRRRLSKFSWKG